MKCEVLRRDKNVAYITRAAAAKLGFDRKIDRWSSNCMEVYVPAAAPGNLPLVRHKIKFVTWGLGGAEWNGAIPTWSVMGAQWECPRVPLVKQCLVVDKTLKGCTCHSCRLLAPYIPASDLSLTFAPQFVSVSAPCHYHRSQFCSALPNFFIAVINLCQLSKAETALGAS